MIPLGVCPEFALWATLVLRAAHGDLDERIASITKEIAGDPRSAVLHLKRAELHRMHGDWLAARADYDRAGALDSSLVDVDLARGRMWLQMGDPRGAKAALDRFLAARPDHPGALLDRGRALGKLGQLAVAIADFDRALARLDEPKPDFYVERARLQAAAGDVDAALRGLKEAQEKLGALITLEVEAMELEVEARRYDAARVRLEAIAGTSERKEPWLVRKAEVLRLAGRNDDARAAFAAALEAIHALPASRRGAKGTLALERKILAALEDSHENR